MVTYSLFEMIENLDFGQIAIRIGSDVNHEETAPNGTVIHYDDNDRLLKHYGTNECVTFYKTEQRENSRWIIINK